MYRRILVIVITTLASLRTSAEADTLKISPAEAEAIFLKENLLILAERLEISKADAMVWQAKLWPNPTVTVEQVNLWTTERQTGGETVVPPLWNNFGKNRQFAIELEQLIVTAGKRRKRIGLEQLNAEKASHNFQHVLLQAKMDFRQTMAELLFQQDMEAIMREQLESLRAIIASYESQVRQGNIPKNEWVRLKAEEIEMSQELNEIARESMELQGELKLWMHLPAATFLVLDELPFEQLRPTAEELSLEQLMQQALENRPELQFSKTDKEFRNQLYLYEKASRVPDLALKGYYDRGGGIVTNFIGFGIAMDLPVFNRNQGNIRAAKIEAEQSELLHKNLEQSIENEIMTSFNNYLSAVAFRDRIEDGYIETLSEMLDAYTRNFKQKNISLIQYIDFLEAYLTSRKSILNAVKSIRETAEELNYSVGTDVIPFVAF